MADKNYKLTFAMSDDTSKDVQFTAPQGPTGATGSRGTGILKVTTAPSSYTTATGGFTPTYRIALSTVKTQAKVSAVLVGDTVMYSYYHYPVGYVDTSYVYLGARNSIRGSTGAAGATGETGPAGYTPVKGTDYWTAADQESIVQQVIAALGTPVYGRVDANGDVVLSCDKLPDGTYTFRFEDETGVVGTCEQTFGEVGPVETMLNLTWTTQTTISSSDGTLSASGNDRMSVSNEYTLKDGAVYTFKNVGAWVDGIYCSTHAYWYGPSGFIGRTHLTADFDGNVIPKGWSGTIEPMAGATKVRFRLNYAEGEGATAEEFVKFYETV